MAAGLEHANARRLARSQWRTGAGLAAFCLFCPTQWENLTWGFQTCFVLPGLFATLSFVSLLLYWARSNSESPAQRKICRPVGAGSARRNLLSGQWSAAVAVLLLAALVLRLRLSGFAHVCDNRFDQHRAVFPRLRAPAAKLRPESLRPPIKLVEYVATYFGSSWTYGNSWTHHNLQIAPWLGSVRDWLIAVVFLWRFRR